MKKILLFILFVQIHAVFAQNVGVGTSTPQQKLEVAGWIELGNETEGSTGTAGTIRYHTTGKIQFHNGTVWADIGGSDDDWRKVGGGVPLISDQMYHTGDVMIGSSSTPGARLDVNGPATGSGITIRAGGGGDVVLANGGSLFFDGNYNYGSGNYIRPVTTNTQAYFTSGAERMRITSAGLVGIGETSPAYKLQVKSGSATAVTIAADGYARDMSGRLARNLVSSHGWTIGTSTVGIFTANEDASTENVREWGDGPHGNRTMLWKAVPSGNGNSDGGWNSQAFEIDHTKSYRVSIWLKRTGTADGTTYVGCSGSNITYLNGTAETNPYFYYGDLPEFDKWYLVVGYIHGSGDASTVSKGGVFDGVTGQKVVSFNSSGNGNTDFKFSTSATTQYHRAYLYYCATASNRQYFGDPRFEEINGHEPTVEALLGISGYSSVNGTTNYVSKFTSSSTLGNSQLYDNGTNVGIGNTSPGEKLHVSGNVRLGGSYALNSDGDHLSMMYGTRTDDNSYEWIGFYSNTTRQGIILYDGAWSGANSLTNEFSLTAENNNLLTLNTTNNHIALMPKNGNVGVNTLSPTEKLDVSGNVKASGIVYWGNAAVRTETRDDAGLQGNAGARSGFYETSAPAPAANWPTGASSWWHLLDVRHSNNSNNYALQIAGSFFDQTLWYRKTNNSASQSWSKLLTPINTYGSNNQSVIATSDVSTTSGTYTAIPGMTITFTPVHSTVYVTFSAAGNYTGTFSAAQYAHFQIVKDGTAVKGGSCSVGEFDDYDGGHNTWNIHLSYPLAVTPGVATTVRVDWAYFRYFTNQTLWIRPSVEPVVHHRHLYILD